MKTRFKRAQVIYNKHIFDRLNEQEHEFAEQCIFRAHEEALIKQRVTKLEAHAILKNQGEVNGHVLKRLKSAEIWIQEGNSTRFVAVEQDIQHLSSRLRQAEATIVSLENKLDTLQKGLCKLEVEKHVLKSCDEKRKRGRPKKV